MSSRALRAGVEVAEEYGLRFEQPVVLRDRSNLLVRLEPLPVVAGVPAVTGRVRHGRRREPDGGVLPAFVAARRWQVAAWRSLYQGDQGSAFVM